MTDLSLFGTAEHPLRCSALPSLVRCPWRAAMLFTGMIQDSSGKAADTGSAVHAAVDSWHGNGQDFAAALRAMRERIEEYPLADFGEAELHFRPYCKDPRNARAEIVQREKKVAFSINPAEGDPHGPIYLRGRLDQIRRGPDGRLYVWDLKTGNPEGWVMVHEHASQLAAYAVGATLTLGEEVHPGGVIRTRGWRKRGVDPASEPDGVFWHAPFDFEGALLILDTVRETVKLLRQGNVTLGPGEHCRFCPAMGLDTCVPKLRSLTLV
jgi:RecB family exonuclease